MARTETKIAVGPRPFRVDVSQAVLDDLQNRLRRTRWTTGPKGDEWDFGMSTRYLQDLSTYWRERYDFRAAEASLNRRSHFEAHVGDHRMHFVHEKGRGPRTIPLLLLHGWPDSFYRYHKVVPMLTSPQGRTGIAFDVVVPSLPGFGFTGALTRTSPREPTRQSAELLWRLMTEVLGYRSFGVVGGDGGSVLAQIIAIDHPASVVGIHLTDLGWHAGNVDPATLTREEEKYLSAGKKQFMADGAYAMVQSTKPTSLSPALTDSPTGLAAWILDRFRSWSDCDGDVEKSFTRDELLTNIMIYWVTRTIGSSMRTYRDDRVSPSLTPDDRVGVPVGLALFPKDIGGVPPRHLAERTLNVQRWSEMPKGGHFAALEQPEAFAGEVIDFFEAIGAGR
jgi:pimeloyl-ACP methyl ester carboxylesterase